MAKLNKVTVTPYTGAAWKYGFATEISGANATALGHTAYSAGTKAVFGANAPKPGRATKKTSTGTISSFYSADKASTLITAGWNVTNPKSAKRSSSARSKVVYVETDGIKYAWRMPVATFTRIGGDAAALGIVEVTAQNNSDLIFGSSFPKPRRAQKVYNPGEANETSVSTFVDDDAALPEGWSETSSGKQSTVGDAEP